MSGLDRRSWLTVLGAVLCLTLTPIQSYIWNGEETRRWLLIARPLLDALADWAPIGAYEFYGSFFFLVYLAPLPLVFRVHGLQKQNRSRSELVGFALTLGALLIGALADFGAYAGGQGSAKTDSPHCNEPPSAWKGSR